MRWLPRAGPARERTRATLLCNGQPRASLASPPPFPLAPQGSPAAAPYYFFSHDGKFVLRPIKSSELQQLQRLLPAYLAHLRNGNFDTLLPHFVGLFTVELEGHAPVHLVGVNNVLFSGGRPLAARYELTGASRRRHVVPDPSDPRGVVLKDHNFSTLGLVHEGRGEYQYPVASNKLQACAKGGHGEGHRAGSSDKAVWRAWTWIHAWLVV